MPEAIGLAIDECIREGILSEFFVRNRAEVLAVGIFEYDEEKVRAVIREDAREEGIEQGIELGIEQANRAGIRILIETCRELGVSRQDALDRIVGKYTLSSEKAQEYMEEFW